MIKSTAYSSIMLGFNSQHLQDSSYLSVTLVTGNALLVSMGKEISWCSDMHTGKIPQNIKKNKQTKCTRKLEKRRGTRNV